jgi:hypothetical protein
MPDVPERFTQIMVASDSQGQPSGAGQQEAAALRPVQDPNVQAMP